MADNKALLDWLENEFFGKPTGADVLTQAPDLTVDQAWRLRSELLQRRLAKGDAHIGYKIAGGGSGIKVEGAKSEPVVGPMLRSGLNAGEPYSFAGAAKVIVEAEVGVMMARDLSGANVTRPEIINAIAGFFPAIEIVPQGNGPRLSLQHRTVGSKLNGAIVLGLPMTPPAGIDLTLEGALISVNGEPKAVGTGMNIMGNPLNAVAEIVRTLAKYGEGLKAGHVLITGTITGTTPVAPGDYIEATLTRLGRATVRFTA
jgi:2-keto-4-pentenoate hydratase